MDIPTDTDTTEIVSWKDQILMDYQGGNVEIGPAEKKMMDIVTRVVAGTIIVWCSFNELMGEISAYRTRRNRSDLQ